MEMVLTTHYKIKFCIYTYKYTHTKKKSEKLKTGNILVFQIKKNDLKPNKAIILHIAKERTKITKSKMEIQTILQHA